MEECSKTVGIRSLDSYWKEAIKLIRFFNYKRFVCDELAIGLVANAIMKAEENWIPGKGKLSTVKFTYVHNILRDIYKSYKTQAKYFPEKIGNFENYPSNDLSQEDIVDYKYITNYVINSDFTHNQKLIFHNYFVEKMPEIHIARNLKVDKSYISETLNIVIHKLKEEFYVE